MSENIIFYLNNRTQIKIILLDANARNHKL